MSTPESGKWYATKERARAQELRARADELESRRPHHPIDDMSDEELMTAMADQRTAEAARELESANPSACEHGEPLPGPCKKCDALACDYMDVRLGCCSLPIGHTGAHKFTPQDEEWPDGMKGDAPTAESDLLADALASLRELLDAPVSGDGATIQRREEARDKARAVLARAKETVDAYPPGVALCPICHQPLWMHSCVDLSCPAS